MLSVFCLLGREAERGGGGGGGGGGFGGVYLIRSNVQSAVKGIFNFCVRGTLREQIET